MTPSLRTIHDTDLPNDEHVRELLGFGLPGLVGPTLLGWLIADGREPLPALSVMGDAPARISIDEAHTVVSSLAGIATHFSDDPGLLIVWKRRGSPAPNDDDLAWLRAAPSACAAAGVRLLGVWLVAGSTAPLRLDAPIPG